MLHKKITKQQLEASKQKDIKRADKYKTINGFTNRPSIAQIVVCLVSLAEIVIAYTIIWNRLSRQNYSHVIFIVPYTVALCFKMVIAVIVTASDPSDLTMIQQINNPSVSHFDQENQENFQDMHRNMSLILLYCRHCQTRVSKGSKHCRTCNRCVSNFDHHCMWVNNCIGGTNYKPFLVMLGSIFANCTLYLFGAIYLSTQFLQSQVPIHEMIILWVSIPFIGLLLIFVTYLIVLHAYLIKNGITTFQFLFSKTPTTDIFKQIKQNNAEKKDQCCFKNQKIVFKNQQNNLQGQFIEKIAPHQTISFENYSSKYSPDKKSAIHDKNNNNNKMGNKNIDKQQVESSSCSIDIPQNAQNMRTIQREHKNWRQYTDQLQKEERNYNKIANILLNRTDCCENVVQTEQNFKEKENAPRRHLAKIQCYFSQNQGNLQLISKMRENEQNISHPQTKITNQNKKQQEQTKAAPNKKSSPNKQKQKGRLQIIRTLLLVKQWDIVQPQQLTLHKCRSLANNSRILQ